VSTLRQAVRQAVGSAVGEAGQSRRRALQTEALLAAMRRQGWTLDSLAMSDAEARGHFANEREVDLFSRIAIRLFHQFKIEFLLEGLGRAYVDSHSILEVGDSDGLVLKALGKRGVSVNNDPRCIDLIRQNGIEGHLGMGEGLAAADKSYDVAMSFETLEHSLDPVSFLREMARVARERVVISVPGVTRTYVHPRVQGMRVGEEHVFELCSRDLLRLTTHLPLRLVRLTKFPVFARPAAPVAALYYWLAREADLFGGCFRWFDFYIFDVVDADQGQSRSDNAAVYRDRR
jgi:SAM-dependent methyltransferase